MVISYNNLFVIFICRLVLGTKALVEEQNLTLEELGVLPNSTIQILGRLPGGGKKRKKKTYTTPKKTKHVKSKVAMPSLSLYTVLEDGSVVKTRRECPGPNCGTGVFMANHYDRQTCGKCGLTIMLNVEDSEED